MRNKIFIILFVKLIIIPSFQTKPDYCRKVSNSQDIAKFCNSQYFYDRGICGIGFVTKYNEGCIKWKHTKDKDGTLLDDTVFCKKHDIYYWCKKNNNFFSNWDYCKEITCDYSISKDICKSKIFWNSTESSIQFDFVEKTFSYNLAIMMYLNENECVISKACSHCPSVDSVITENFYLCKSENNFNITTKIVTFNRLKENTDYKFFLIPIENNWKLGTLAMISLKTKIKPVFDINLKEMNSTSISIELESKSDRSNSKMFEYYQIEIFNINLNNKKTVGKISENKYTISKLFPCTKYCIVVNIFIRSGIVESHSISANTYPIFDEVQLTSYEKTQFNSFLIKWKYQNTYNCSIIYSLKYFTMNNISEPPRLTTNLSMELKEINPNETYFIQVKPEYNNESGEYSKPKRIRLTCDDRVDMIKIEQNKTKLNISWEYYKSDCIENNIFRIIVETKSDKCLVELKTLQLNKTENTNNSLINENITNCNLENETNIFLYNLTKYQIIINLSADVESVTLSLITSYGFNQALQWITYKPTISLHFTLLKSYTYIVYIIIFILMIYVACHFVYKRIYDIKNTITIFKRKTFSKRFTIYEYMPEISHQNIGKSNEILCTKRSINFYLKEENSELLKSEIVKEYRDLILFVNKSEMSKSESESLDSYCEIAPLDNNKKNIFYIPFENKPFELEYIFYKDNSQSLSELVNLIWDRNIMIILILHSSNIANNNQLESWNDERFSVSADEDIETDAYIEKKLRIMKKTSKEYRRIIQLYVSSWNEFLNPNFEIFEKVTFRYHELISIVQKPPYLVHCNSGFGRVNCFATIDRIIRELVNGEFYIDVFEKIQSMRNLQKNIILRESQYIFIHKFIQYFLKKYSMKIQQNNVDNTYFTIVD